ncbi:MAG: flagellar basal body-associated FliL family protein [Stellaceae bacterium]
MATIARDTRDPPAARRRTRRLGRRLVMLFGLLAVVASAAVGGWYYWQYKKATVVAAPVKPIYVVIKPFVVTMLDDNQVTRFVQVGVDLEVTNKAAADRVQQVLPAIEDAIRLQILQSKLAEVTSPQGVEQLRKALIVQANHAIETTLDPPPDPHAPKPQAKSQPSTSTTAPKPGHPPAPPAVRNLYFTELVVE